MSKQVYFLDASALVHYYATPGTRPESRLIHARVKSLLKAAADSSGAIVLQVPNICMAECAGAFARLCFETRSFGAGDQAQDAYRKMRDTLLNDVGRTRLIHSYELKRVHFDGIEDIFVRDYQLSAPRRGSRLSSHDALIVAMAKEYPRGPRGR